MLYPKKIKILLIAVYFRKPKLCMEIFTITSKIHTGHKYCEILKKLHYGNNYGLLFE